MVLCVSARVIPGHSLLLFYKIKRPTIGCIFMCFFALSLPRTGRGGGFQQKNHNDDSVQTGTSAAAPWIQR